MGSYSIDNATGVQGRYANVVTAPTSQATGNANSSNADKIVVDDVKIQQEVAKNNEKKPLFTDERKTKEEVMNDEKEMSAITEILNKFVAQWNAHLQFSLHKEASLMSIKFVDMKTNKVLKEFPAEEYLDMIGNIRKYIGAMVDEKV